MSTKIKHNKKRNTIFLYETLVRELTKATVDGEQDRREAILSIVKEHFSAGTALGREVRIYKNILETKDTKEAIAEKILSESKVEYSVLNKKQIFTEQSQMISKINKELSKDVFSTFVPNYKNLATLHQVFNNLDLSAKERVLLEEEAVQLMVEAKKQIEKKELKHIDSLVFKSFVERFNKEYTGLLEEQKTLLSRFIASGVGNDLEFQIYLDNEIGRLKEEVSTAKETEEFKNDSDMMQKAHKVIDLLESFSQKPLEDTDLKNILKIQELAKEIKK
jgi:antitoxin component HigA of HigAB toxin-antitoxin module